MRIVDLTTLRAMPQGTLYQKWAPCLFGDMRIFDHALGEHGFVACEFGSDPIGASDLGDFVAKCHAMADDGISVPVGFDSYGRDVLLKNEQLFAVWEPDDVRALIAKLQEGLARGIETETSL